MIRTLPSSRGYRWGYSTFIGLYFFFLFAPLCVTCVLAFNNSDFPSLPWGGFSWDWFVANGPGRVGIFHDSQNLRALWTSFHTAFWVSLACTAVGTCAAFLFEQERFPGRQFLYFLMLAPLVIPGVILGISILVAANTVGMFLEDTFGIDVAILRPSFWLVVLGQFAFITTFVTLVVSARLRKFDRSLEEAALNLGATRLGVIWHITLRYLRPAIINSAAVAFLMSFENFNTTLFLVGSQPTLPINLYLQVRDGSTPVINAISLLMILGTAVLVLGSLASRKKDA
ncbi:ABC transporter permease [Megalodesulfovibrio paquesii]